MNPIHENNCTSDCINDSEANRKSMLFDVSHTMRGSVTSIMAICTMLDRSTLSSENKVLLEYLDTAVQKLGADLTKMSQQIDSL
jgi:hypothetical protein